MIEILLLPIIGGFLVVSSLSPLGCIALWRRFSYLGDAISHSSILGIVLGLFFNVNITISIALMSLIFASIMVGIRKRLESTASVIIFSYGFLALGLFLLPFVVDNVQIDIFSYLFGDILLIDLEQILLMSISSSIALVWLWFRWKALVLISINEDFACAEGVNVKIVDLEYNLITALIIGISIKVIGVLLVAAMLVMPAAASRNLSKSPLQMLVLSVFCGYLAIVGGMFLSYQLDSSSGPSIVVTSLIIFLLSLFFKKNSA